MKLKRVSITTVMVVVGFFFIDCEQHSPKLKADDNGAISANMLTVAEANNRFALELYSQLSAADKESNIFFSPYSISSALAMTYEGSRGKTAQEIQSVFHFSADDRARRESFAAIYNKINKKTDDYKLHTANALWVQKDFKILSAYRDTIEKFYGGRTANVDFAKATEEARKTINEWVEEKTNYKIKNLFSQGALRSLTRLVLTNAIYFKGDWLLQFNKNETKKEDFKVNQNKTVKVSMMKQTGKEAKFGYADLPARQPACQLAGRSVGGSAEAETEHLQILEMPYKGEELSMLVLLPKGEDLGVLEKQISPEKLKLWNDKLQKRRVDVYIPKFKMETQYRLNDELATLGMPSAFQESKADFSGITGAKGIFIELVVHKAYVDVNEEGTEAAAATGVAMGLTSAPPPTPVFRADHPFIFLIQERKTGNILFLGRVVDPNR